MLAGGICIALFVVILYPVGGFFGAAHANHPNWAPAHTLHFAGALLTVFGVCGVYARQAQQVGTLGLIGFLLALAGTAQFVGTGMLTAFVWPALAVNAPAMIDVDGAMFMVPASLIFYCTGLSLVAGYTLLGIATMRAGVLPWGGGLLLIVGVILSNGPVEPVGYTPWAGLTLGGILFGAGQIWLGYALWTGTRKAAPT